MFHLRTKAPLSVCLAAILVAVSAIALHAYSTYGKWGTSSVLIYMNPQNADVTASAAETAVQVGMSAWNTQSNANFRFAYGGRVGDTTTGYDNRNVVIFRNASNAGAIASTYAWSVGDQLVDADVIFWDEGFTFITGASACVGGVYIEDVAAHELGHVLGLLHSADPAATMYSGYPYCSQELRTLAADDISGIQSLYGVAGTTANKAPSVSITAPLDGSAYVEGTVVSFAGSANDAQDGNLASALQWTSSLDGAIGTGSAFTHLLTVGTHVITARVADSAGLSGSSSVSVTVNAASTVTNSIPLLSATGSRIKRQLKISLAWSGFSASMLDIYRNNVLILTTPNDGAQTDTIRATSGAFVYQACASGTKTCSNQATVTF